MSKGDALNVLEQAIGKISEFLLHRQLEIPAITLNSELKPEENQVFQIGAKSYKVYFRFHEGKWQWSNNNNTFHPIPIGVLFPIYFENEAEQHSSEKKAGSALSHRLRNYVKKYGFFIRVARKFEDLFSLPVLENRIKYKKSPIDKNISKKGGLRFIADTNGTEIKLRCTDNGGIFDTNLNTQEKQFPAQVPLGYYSTEYAVYVFFDNWRRTKDVVWKHAMEKGIDFFLQNFKPKTAIAFDHYEFKVLPLSLMLLELMNMKDAGISTDKILQLRNTLSDEWHSYQPVNVFALRLANSAVFREIGIAYSNLKIKEAKKKINRHQTEQGLIMDNIGGASIASADLTYHQFSLACLSIAYKYGKYPELEPKIERALSFSNYLVLSNAHINYYGRGANNIYHIASYMYALSCSEKPDIQNIIEMTNRFLSAFNTETGLPSALNKHPELRMGWNHCSIPYQGQTLFFIALCYNNLLAKENKKSIKTVDIDTETQKIDYYKLSNEFFECVVVRGADPYAWSNGGYVSGISGIAGLSVKNKFISLTSCFSTRYNTMISDIPHYNTIDELRPQKLKKSGNGCTLYCKETEAKYILNGNRLEVLYTVEGEGMTQGGLPIQDAVSISKSGLEFILNITDDIVIKLSFYHNNEQVDIESKEVLFNPYGKGKLLMPQLLLKKGDTLKMVLTEEE